MTNNNKKIHELISSGVLPLIQNIQTDDLGVLWEYWNTALTYWTEFTAKNDGVSLVDIQRYQRYFEGLKLLINTAFTNRTNQIQSMIDVEKSFLKGRSGVFRLPVKIEPIIPEYYGQYSDHETTTTATQPEQTKTEATGNEVKTIPDVIHWSGHDKARFLSKVFPETEPIQLAKDYWIKLGMKNENSLYGNIKRYRNYEIKEPIKIPIIEGIAAMKAFLES